MARWAVRGVGIAIGIAFIAAGPSTRTLGVIIVVIAIASAIAFEGARKGGSLASQEYVRSYNGTADETFEALHSAVTSLRYRVRSIDVAKREISFNTRMSRKTWAGQDFTAVVHPKGRKSELQLVGATSQRGPGAIQSVSWGETEKLGNRVLDRTYEELHPATKASR